MPRQGKLNQYAVHHRIGIQLRHALQKRGFGYLLRKLVHFGAHAGFLAGARLVAHVDARGGVIPHEDRRQPGAHAASGKRFDRAFLGGAQLGGERFPVDQCCSHGIL